MNNSKFEIQTSEKPVIAVVGFPRSGTSLLMRMLHHGGVGVVADNSQSYETGRASVMSPDQSWLRECGGKAVKLLEPHRLELPKIRYDFLWCERDPTQQAKSQVKLLRGMAGFKIPADAWRQMREGIEEDTPSVKAELRGFPQARMWTVRFEAMLACPLVVASGVARFLARDLNVEAMAAQVVKRSPKCYEGFLELEQFEQEKQNERIKMQRQLTDSAGNPTACEGPEPGQENGKAETLGGGSEQDPVSTPEKPKRRRRQEKAEKDQEPVPIQHEPATTEEKPIANSQ